MHCDKCLKIITLSALSVGKCKVCGEPTYTPHIPSYEVCKLCSEKLRLCEQCGKEMKE